MNTPARATIILSGGEVRAEVSVLPPHVPEVVDIQIDTRSLPPFRISISAAEAVRLGSELVAAGEPAKPVEVKPPAPRTEPAKSKDWHRVRAKNGKK